MENNAWLILIAAIVYILGSVPIAYFVTRGIIRKDISVSGSRNIGAMNTYRLIRNEKSVKLSIAGFVLVLIGDMGKGALAVYIAKWLSFLGYSPLPAMIIGSFFVILGHNYSLFFKFRRGGRGLAPLGGVIIFLNPVSFIIGLAAFLISIFLVHYLLVGRINWRRSSEVFSIAGSQIMGRVVGLIVVLIILYLFGTQIFYPTMAGIILVLIKHIDRVKAYVGELRR